jgi:site-specific DNA recombinase
MQAIGYVRVSTEEQATEGISLDQQQAAIRAYCTLRGLTLAEIVVDAGVSGGKALEARDGGKRILAALCKRSGVGAIVACKLDRLFRDAANCLTVTKAWDRAGVALHLLDVGGQTVDTSSTMGRFFLTVMAACTEMERGLIKDRTRTAMGYLRRNHQRISRRIPFGFRLEPDGKSLVPDTVEQAAVSDMRAMRSSGLTYRAIASALDGRGIKSREGKAWQPNSVRLILQRSALRSAA